MRGIRQRLTKVQWFALFNCAAAGALYATGNLRWRAGDLVPAILVLGAVNAANFVAARKYKDWKK